MADRLSVSRATAYKLALRGEFPHLRVGNAIRVRPEDLASYLSRRIAGKTGGIPPPSHDGGTS